MSRGFLGGVQQADVDAAVAELIAGAPGSFDTLNELAAGKADLTRTLATKTDNYTLVAGDAGKVIEMNKATANTLTVPPNSSVAFPVGTYVDVVQIGAGTTTITAGGGVTIRSPGGLALVQYGSARLTKRATDEWELTALSSAFARADPAGLKVTVDPAAPSNPTVDDIWIDTDEGLLLGEQHATVNLVNSTTETALATFTVPGGRLKAGDVLRFRAWGDEINSSGSSVNKRWRFKIGATTVLDTNNVSYGNAAGRRQWFLDLEIVVESTTAERVGGNHAGSAAIGSTETFPISATTLGFIGSGTAAEDLTVDKAFAYTMTMGTASASADVRCFGASLTITR